MRDDDFGRRRALNVITRWTAPKPAEPAHGFMMRLASLHYEASATTFVRRLGVHSMEIPERYVDAIGGSELARPDHLAVLRAWTPHFPDEGKGFGHLAGQEIRRLDWSIRSRRFCPACLAEDEYHRSWFDLTFFGTCPLHGLPLTDVCPDGSHAFFNSAAIAMLPSGVRLDRTTPRLAQPPATIERYALGRLGVMDAWPVELLDGAALWEVVEAADILGRLKAHGWSQTAPPQGTADVSVEAKAVGFQVLAGGRDAIFDLFRMVAGQAPTFAHGERRIFGWASANLWKRGGLCGVIHAIGGDVAVALGRQSRRWRPPEGANLAERVTMQQVAALFGRSDDVITSIVRELDLMLPHKGGSGHPFLMESRHLDQVEDVLSNTLSRDDAAAYLGLEVERFNELARAGFVEKLGSRWGDKSGGGRATGQVDRFRREVLDDFLDGLPMTHPADRADRNVNASRLLSVADALNLTGYDTGDFFEGVRDGRLTIDTCAHGGGGLRDFRIDPARQPRDEAFTKRCMSVMATRGRRTGNGMSIREAGAILEVDAMPLQLLVEQGLIPTMEREGREQYRIDRAGVLAFHRRYATAKVWAAKLGTNNSKANQMLKKMGLSPSVSPVLPEGRAAKTPLVDFYDRAEVNQALGLRYDPEALDHNRIVWKRLAAYLGQTQSSFTVWRIYDDAALVSDSNYEWPMNVRHEFHEVPPDPDPDVFAYAVDVVLIIAGKHAPPRVARIVEVTKTRQLHPAIEVKLLDEGRALEARIRARITVDRSIDPDYTPDRGMEFVARHGEYEAKVVERAVYMLRGSLEPSERPFDRRLFGHGAFEYRAFALSNADAPPLVEPWRSPLIEAEEVEGYRRSRYRPQAPIQAAE